MKIVVIGGYPESLTKFRGHLLDRLVEPNNEVLALAGCDSEQVRADLADKNIRFEVYPLQRTGLNPLSDIRTLLYLYRFFKKQKPDLLFSYTIKPVVWGSIAAKLAGVPRINAMVTGLGNQLGTSTVKQRVVSRIITALYRTAFKCCRTVIFQNNDDVKELKQRGALEGVNVCVVNGSGVDLHEYPQTPLPASPIVFLTIARFLIAKGIREYVEAARIIKRNRPDVIFKVVGFADEGESAISVTELQALHDEGIIELVGKVDSSYLELQKSHIYVLASFYGEGLPRTILEALSVGRPVLTTDNVGCREAVEHEVNGLIVEPRNARALIDGMRWFLDNESRWPEMANASRELAVEKYDVNKVNKEMLRILDVTS